MNEQAIKLFETKKVRTAWNENETPEFRRNDRCITVGVAQRNLRKKDVAPARLNNKVSVFYRKLRYACIRLCTSHACGVGLCKLFVNVMNEQDLQKRNKYKHINITEFRRNDRCITVGAAQRNLRKKDATPARLNNKVSVFYRKLRCACIRLCTSHACGVDFSKLFTNYSYIQ